MENAAIIKIDSESKKILKSLIGERLTCISCVDEPQFSLMTRLHFGGHMVKVTNPYQFAALGDEFNAFRFEETDDAGEIAYVVDGQEIKYVTVEFDFPVSGILVGTDCVTYRWEGEDCKIQVDNSIIMESGGKKLLFFSTNNIAEAVQIYPPEEVDEILTSRYSPEQLWDIDADDVVYRRTFTRL